MPRNVKEQKLNQTATVVTKSVHLRDIPAGKIIGSVSKGDKLIVTDRAQRPQHLWLRVKIGRKVGWVAASPKWVKLNPVELPPPPDVEPPFQPDETFDPMPIVAGAALIALVLVIAIWLGT